MTTTLTTQAGVHLSVQVASPEAFLQMPKAKAPRISGDWAESDGIDYDLREPIYLEPLSVVVDVKTTQLFNAGDTCIFDLLGTMLASTISHVTPHEPFNGWQRITLTPSMLPLFGMPVVVQGVFTPEDLRTRLGIKVAPDVTMLRSEPERKVALEASSKAEDASTTTLGAGKKERNVTMEVWVRGENCVRSHLDFCKLLRQRAEGRWRIAGKDYYLRYQSMEVTDYAPNDIVASRVTFQQYRY
jgi:hypothetical protein